MIGRSSIRLGLKALRLIIIVVVPMMAVAPVPVPVRIIVVIVLAIVVRIIAPVIHWIRVAISGSDRYTKITLSLRLLGYETHEPER